eukprot:CAMPEP_0170545194 /NCGR_PEP_ID=MMETSP0211-20121228/3670_1 /TAXON_ID=311385 /ORGANISM="Pseudokeronopsis sp., Strain OXSARD2" /LENGTH=165 /DNA_ID=CAMNT_0010849037 /DNA_START=9083 /DNA_END=9580 /DNA_ORIENTATION=-
MGSTSNSRSSRDMRAVLRNLDEAGEEKPDTPETNEKPTDESKSSDKDESGYDERDADKEPVEFDGERGEDQAEPLPLPTFTRDSSYKSESGDYMYTMTTDGGMGGQKSKMIYEINGKMNKEMNEFDKKMLGRGKDYAKSEDDMMDQYDPHDYYYQEHYRAKIHMS